MRTLAPLCALVCSAVAAGTPVERPADAPSPADPRDRDADVAFGYGESPRGWSSGCQKGLGQSPINIVHAAPAQSGDPPLRPLSFSYKASRVELANYGGHVPRIRFPGGSTVTDSVGGETYTLSHADIHAPGEHQLRGLTFPLEVALVHFAQDGRPLVVSVLYKEGASSPLLAALSSSFPAAAGATVKRGIVVDPSELLPAEKTYYRYTGSLTVPPCTGNAPVFVLDGFAHASRGQIEALRAAFGGNARAVQPAYGRRPREYRAAADAKVPVPLEK